MWNRRGTSICCVYCQTTPVLDKPFLFCHHTKHLTAWVSPLVFSFSSNYIWFSQLAESQNFYSAKLLVRTPTYKTTISCHWQVINCCFQSQHLDVLHQTKYSRSMTRISFHQIGWCLPNPFSWRKTLLPYGYIRQWFRSHSHVLIYIILPWLIG